MIHDSCYAPHPMARALRIEFTGAVYHVPVGSPLARTSLRRPRLGAEALPAYCRWATIIISSQKRRIQICSSGCGQGGRHLKQAEPANVWLQSSSKPLVSHVLDQTPITISLSAVTPPSTFPIRPPPAPALFSSPAPVCQEDSRTCEECASRGHGVALARFLSPSNR